eukprot:TRINITY_DN27742_c0_g2_i1.p1 TRINITY_DN27742_c0_g2~~TRINITY_DN27742_c0_g2_i1.p1  ORF type:complete len:557 (-),score=70.82 TRINITY_DN27742_c0_g2_i1:252-1922(-)
MPAGVPHLRTLPVPSQHPTSPLSPTSPGPPRSPGAERQVSPQVSHETKVNLGEAAELLRVAAIVHQGHPGKSPRSPTVPASAWDVAAWQNMTSTQRKTADVPQREDSGNKHAKVAIISTPLDEIGVGKSESVIASALDRNPVVKRLLPYSTSLNMTDVHLLMGCTLEAIDDYTRTINYQAFDREQYFFEQEKESDWITPIYGEAETGYDFVVAIRAWHEAHDHANRSAAEVLLLRGSSGVDRATAYVSHVQSQPLHATLQGVRKHCWSDHVWLDYVCLRQCKPEFDVYQIQKVVGTIGNTLALEDSGTDASGSQTPGPYMSRLFCIFEIAVTPAGALTFPRSPYREAQYALQGSSPKLSVADSGFRVTLMFASFSAPCILAVNWRVWWVACVIRQLALFMIMLANRRRNHVADMIAVDARRARTLLDMDRAALQRFAADRGGLDALAKRCERNITGSLLAAANKAANTTMTSRTNRLEIIGMLVFTAWYLLGSCIVSFFPGAVDSGENEKAVTVSILVAMVVVDIFLDLLVVSLATKRPAPTNDEAADPVWSYLVP